MSDSDWVPGTKRTLAMLEHEYSTSTANDQALVVLDHLINAVHEFGLMIDYCQSCKKTLVTIDSGETPYCGKCSAN